MAIRMNTTAENFKVISQHDDAVAPDITEEELEQYKETLDESFLRLVGEPTRFVMRKTLPFKAQQEVTNQQVKVGSDGRPQVNFGFILEDVRCSLIGIENPADLPEDQKLVFKKDADGYASMELVAKLNAIGIASELFSAKQVAVKTKASPEKK